MAMFLFQTREMALIALARRSAVAPVAKATDNLHREATLSFRQPHFPIWVHPNWCTPHKATLSLRTRYE